MKLVYRPARPRLPATPPMKVGEAMTPRDYCTYAGTHNNPAGRLFKHLASVLRRGEGRTR